MLKFERHHFKAVFPKICFWNSEVNVNKYHVESVPWSNKFNETKQFNAAFS